MRPRATSAGTTSSSSRCGSARSPRRTASSWLPEESLLLSLTGAAGENGFTVRGIGDAWAPGTIAAAVWSGRRYAEELDAALPSSDDVPFRREVTELALLPLIQS